MPILVIILMVLSTYVGTEKISITSEAGKVTNTIRQFNHVLSHGVMVTQHGTVHTTQDLFEVKIPIELEDVQNQFVIIKEMGETLKKANYTRERFLNLEIVLIQENHAPGGNFSETVNPNMQVSRVVNLIRAMDDHMKSQTARIEKKLDNLDQVFGSNLQKRKRGLFNFIGIGMGWMYGLATEGQIQQIEKELLTLESNKLLFQTSAKNMNTILKYHDVEIKDLTNNLADLNRLSTNMADHITHLEMFVGNLQSHMLRFSQISWMSETYFLRISAIFDNFEAKIDKLTRGLTAALAGRLDPSLINADHLEQLIQHIQVQFPPFLNFPLFGDQLGRAADLYKTAEVQLLTNLSDPRAPKYVSVGIRIALQTDRYKVYKLTQIGVPFGPKISELLRIKIDTYPNYAVNQDRVVILTDAELNSCSLIDHVWRCNFFQTKVLEGSLSHCVRSLLTSDSNAHKACPTEIVAKRDKTQIVQLAPGVFAFNVREPIEIQVSCADNSVNKQFNITNFGILKVPSFCGVQIQQHYFGAKFIQGVPADFGLIDLDKDIKIELADNMRILDSPLWENLGENTTVANITDLKNLRAKVAENLNTIQLCIAQDICVNRTQVHNKTRALLHKVDELLNSIEGPDQTWYEGVWSILAGTSANDWLWPILILGCIISALYTYWYCIIKKNNQKYICIARRITQAESAV